MTREEGFHSILEASAKFQSHIADILEAKAVEAVKAKNWVWHHVFADSFENHEGQLSFTSEIHDHIIEVIDGLTKMETSLASNLKAVLHRHQQEDGGGLGMGADFLNFGEES
ncbi:restriction endonuclease subunit S [Ferviditalea candida]|uniref:Restriction endonuclease subunit S n=1 Tax=Ferviditalea candida TaxID=3108399 RepID=A0ABU5ZEU8_9BACL|nr:restriction endonuclease subunit S [Paenibacillaceae bacterium T2]